MAIYNTTGSTTSDQAPVPSVLNPSVVASFLASLPAELQTVAPTVIDASSSNITVTAPLAAVAPGAAVSVDVAARAGILLGGGSSVDLLSSQRSDGSPVPVSVVATGGNNTILLNKGPSFALSTSTNDTIMSSGGRDMLRSAIGQDSLVGGGQSHLVGGVSGNDTLVGGLTESAQDTIISQGSSHIRASLGSNTVVSNAGDTIQAGQSSSTIQAGDGAATIRGGSGAQIYGSGNASILAGGGQNNTFNLDGSDTLVAGRGSNAVDIAAGGQASVHGGVGHLDVNVADGGGNDTLFGGKGGLTIHVSAGAGAIVNDPNTLDAAGYHVVQFAGGETLHVSNVTIDFGNGQRRDV